ncbi:AAA family ATPase [Dietzia sp. NPDC055340]
MRSPPPGSRLAVIDDIASAVDLTTGGTRARTVVVTAGPGVGKTYALRELAGRPLGRATRWTVADDLSWRQPYAVAATLLGVPVPCPVPLDFVTSLDAVVDSLCAEEPQLLIVDDAHNADSGTLEFLGSLSAVARDLPLAILLARRHLPLRASLARLLSRPWVAEWHLPAMDEAELAALCHQQLGAWPDRALADLLARSCGNPLHARAMLDELRAAGNVVVADERATVRGAVGTVSSVSLETAVGQQLSLLDAQSRALVQKVAVWGGPVTLDELALLDDVPPASLIGAAQTAIDAGVIIAAAQGGLTVTHDVYADVAYDGLDQSLRRVLHTAIARHHESRGRPQLVAHHLLAAGADGSTAATAISDAQGELVGAPAVAADLLDTAVASDTPLPTRTLELDLATALARSGQLARATEVAEQGLAACSDPAILARLHRVLLFSLIAQGRTSQVLELIAQTLRLPVDSPTRDVLLDLQRYVRLLAGEAPVSPEPYPVSDPGNVSEMVTEALRRFLTGDGIGGLGLAPASGPS